MMNESMSHAQMDSEFEAAGKRLEELEQAERDLVEAKKRITELEKEHDDLQAYKDLAIELANRKGYDSLAGVFDDWNRRDLEQQAKGVEDAVGYFAPARDIDVEALKSYAEQLRKQAEEL